METLSIDRELNKEHVMEKSCRKLHQQLAPAPFLIFLITQNSHCTHDILLKIRFFERGLSKSLKIIKKLSLFFLSNPVPFNGQSYQKQKRSGTSHQYLFRP